MALSFIGAATGLIGSLVGSSQQSDASNNAINFQQNAFNTTQANLKPYMTAGTGALTQLQIALGLLPPSAANPTTGGTAGTPATAGAPTGGYMLQQGAYQQDNGAGPGAGVGTGPATVQGTTLLGPNGQVIQSWPAGTSQDVINAWLTQNNIPMSPGTAGTAGTPGTATAGGSPYGAFVSSPGYQYALNQGQGAIQNSASATGGVNSGTTLKALQQNAMGLANQNWQQWLGGITGLAQGGQNAAANLGGIGQNFANATSNLMVGQGNANAAGTVGATNAITNYLSNQSYNPYSGTASIYNSPNLSTPYNPLSD